MNKFNFQPVRLTRSSPETTRWVPPDVSTLTTPAVESDNNYSHEVALPSPEEIAILVENARATASEAGYQTGYKAGYQVGHQSGHQAGYPNGQETGYKDGQQAGHAAGYQEGYQTGYAVGYQEGRSQADQDAVLEQQARTEREQAWQAEQENMLRTTVTALEGVASNLADPLAQLTETLEPELLILLTTLARRVVQAELQTQPELICQVLHRALQQLPSRNHLLQVKVHPDDQVILERYAEAQLEKINWISDATLERGGCQIISGPSRIDASVETRLRQAIDAVWGELTQPVDQSKNLG